MPDRTDSHVALADAVADIMRGIAGWLIVGIGVVWLLAMPTVALLYPEPLVVMLVLVGSFLSLSTVGAGLYVNPRFRPRFERRRSLSTFGRGRCVDHRIVYPGEAESWPCFECGERFDAGMISRYRKEQYVFGLPVRTLSEGHNAYCRDCALQQRTDVPSNPVPVDGASTDSIRTDRSESASPNPAATELEQE